MNKPLHMPDKVAHKTIKEIADHFKELKNKLMSIQQYEHAAIMRAYERQYLHILEDFDDN